MLLKALFRFGFIANRHRCQTVLCSFSSHYSGLTWIIGLNIKFARHMLRQYPWKGLCFYVQSWLHHIQYKDLCCSLQETCCTASFFVCLFVWKFFVRRCVAGFKLKWASIFGNKNKNFSVSTIDMLSLCSFWFLVILRSYVLEKSWRVCAQKCSPFHHSSIGKCVRAAEAVISHGAWSLCNSRHGFT